MTPTPFQIFEYVALTGAGFAVGIVLISIAIAIAVEVIFND